MNQLESNLFKEGLRSRDLSKISKIPKGDVHNHCGLGMRFKTFNKWAGGNVKAPPKKIDGLKGLDDYIFTETIKFIKNDKDIAFLIEATVKEAIGDGVKVLEPSIDCGFILDFDNEKSFFTMIKDVREKYEGYIDFRPEVGMAKSIPNKKIDKLLIPCIDSGVFKSIDLYGDEALDDFYRFKEYYKYAKEKGLKLKAHAGEFHGPLNVQKAIEILELDEVQHGIGACSSDYVIDLIKERNIRLNICPSSNNILGAVKDMKSHPVRKLFDKGVNITINTDDLLLFDSGASEEYLYLYKLGIFNEDEINTLRENSLK